MEYYIPIFSMNGIMIKISRCYRITSPAAQIKKYGGDVKMGILGSHRYQTAAMDQDAQNVG